MPTAGAAIAREHVAAFVEDQLAKWKPATANTRYRALQAVLQVGRRRRTAAPYSLVHLDLLQERGLWPDRIYRWTRRGTSLEYSDRIIS
jgi:hypothetical protein